MVTALTAVALGRLGRFLFRTRFAELPEVNNVTRGDMSLTSVDVSLKR